MRYFLSGCFLVSIFFFPWWGSVLLGAIFSFLVRDFWEILPAFFILDIVYGAPDVWWGFEFLLTSIAVVIYLGARFFHSRLWVSRETLLHL